MSILTVAEAFGESCFPTLSVHGSIKARIVSRSARSTIGTIKTTKAVVVTIARSFVMGAFGKSRYD
jgi:hypothetical protein